MEKLKVVGVTGDYLTFNNGFKMWSDHNQDCCEQHYLDFSDLQLRDFEGLEFDLSTDDFFNRIEDYGIELKPVEGYSVKIPGYGSNNGYYGSNIDLVLSDSKGIKIKTFDVSECQQWYN